MAKRTDFFVNDQCTIVLLRPITQAALDWSVDHLHGAMIFGGAFVIEHRYAKPIVDGFTADGLTARAA